MGKEIFINFKIMQVEIMSRTPFGGPGEIVEVEREVFEAYSSDILREVKETKNIENKAILEPKITKKIK